MLPLLTSSRPASIRRVVDLPQPEGPTRTMNSPSLISRLMPGTAGSSAPGYHRWAFSNVTDAMTHSLLHRQERAGRSVVEGTRDTSEGRHTGRTLPPRPTSRCYGTVT